MVALLEASAPVVPPSGAPAYHNLTFGPLLGETLRRRHPFLSTALAKRLARLYGTRAETLLEGARSEADLGPRFGADLHAREVDYLMRHEWAASAEDILWRRTKLGLRLTADEATALDSHVRAALSRADAAG